MSPVNSKEVNLPPSEISIDVFCKKHELLKRNKIVIQNIGFLTCFQEPLDTHLVWRINAVKNQCRTDFNVVDEEKE